MAVVVVVVVVAENWKKKDLNIALHLIRSCLLSSSTEPLIYS